MKKIWILLFLLAPLVHADSPQITLPTNPPSDSDNQNNPAAPPEQPISTTVTDPHNKSWKEYENRIVKIHIRVKTAWTLMELKETQQTGTVSFTLSRLPLVTFAVTRDSLDGDFDSYLSSAALTPIYPTGYKIFHTEFAGRKSVRVRGKEEDGRMDESFFSAEGHSFYRVSFAAPPDGWRDFQQQLDDLKASFQWLK